MNEIFKNYNMHSILELSLIGANIPLHISGDPRALLLNDSLVAVHHNFPCTVTKCSVVFQIIPIESTEVQNSFQKEILSRAKIKKLS